METAALLLWFHFVSFPFSAKPTIANSQALKRDHHKGKSFAYFERHESHQLSPSSVKKVATKEDSSMDCGFVCVRLSWCVSFNFQRSSDAEGKHLCEVLSADKYNNSQNFQASKEFDHFSLPVSLFFYIFFYILILFLLDFEIKPGHTLICVHITGNDLNSKLYEIYIQSCDKIEQVR